MREREVERRLTLETKKRSGMALKFVSPGCSGVPDRLVLMPEAHMAFVELKAPGRKLRPLQVRRKTQLERLGFQVYVVDGVEQIDAVLNAIGGDAR